MWPPQVVGKGVDLGGGVVERPGSGPVSSSSTRAAPRLASGTCSLSGPRRWPVPGGCGETEVWQLSPRPPVGWMRWAHRAALTTGALTVDKREVREERGEGGWGCGIKGERAAKRGEESVRIMPEQGLSRAAQDRVAGGVGAALTEIKREEEREMCHVSFGRSMSPGSYFSQPARAGASQRCGGSPRGSRRALRTARPEGSFVGSA